MAHVLREIANTTKSANEKLTRLGDIVILIVGYDDQTHSNLCRLWLWNSCNDREGDYPSILSHAASALPGSAENGRSVKMGA
jgi:hypothetical protein